MRFYTISDSIETHFFSYDCSNCPTQGITAGAKAGITAKAAAKKWKSSGGDCFKVGGGKMVSGTCINGRDTPIIMHTWCVVSIRSAEEKTENTENGQNLYL